MLEKKSNAQASFNLFFIFSDLIPNQASQNFPRVCSDANVNASGERTGDQSRRRERPQKIPLPRRDRERGDDHRQLRAM
jgi:hypothetical protein